MKECTNMSKFKYFIILLTITIINYLQSDSPYPNPMGYPGNTSGTELYQQAPAQSVQIVGQQQETTQGSFHKAEAQKHLIWLCLMK